MKKPQPLKPEDSLEMFAGCDAERAIENALAQAEELSAELRRPLGDVSEKVGDLERNSPLFFGTGDNPSLF